MTQASDISTKGHTLLWSHHIELQSNSPLITQDLSLSVCTFCKANSILRPALCDLKYKIPNLSCRYERSIIKLFQAILLLYKQDQILETVQKCFHKYSSIILISIGRKLPLISFFFSHIIFSCCTTFQLAEYILIIHINNENKCP